MATGSVACRVHRPAIRIPLAEFFPAPDGYQVRTAGHEDLTCLAALERRAATRIPSDRIDPTSTVAADALASGQRSGWLFCATPSGAGDAVVGFLLTEPRGPELHLIELSVDPEHGGRGLGRALLTAAERRARQGAFNALTLTTFADLPFNAPFYERLGFQRLPHDDPSLASELAAERAAGLTQRVAMRKRLEVS